MKDDTTKKVSALHPLVIVILLFGSIIFLLSILYVESNNTKNTQIKSLEVIGKVYSNSISVYRDFYSKVILKRLHNSNIEITHDYKSKENAIPIPATMSLDLVSYLNIRDADINLRISSEYPYPWRKNRIFSGFDKEATNYFETTSEEYYFKLLNRDDKQYFEYAIPIKMSASCVDCHNSHPDSPKKDWKIGDTRGIQVVSIYPNIINDENEFSNRIYLIILIIIFFAFNISVIVWLLRKDKDQYNIILKDKEKLRIALDEAKEANAAKSQFLANMSHEIRTPLNAIIGFSEILSQSYLSKSEKEQAKIIHKSGISLLDIINDILDFSKIESGQFELFEESNELKLLSQDVTNLFEIKAKEKNIKLNIQIDEKIPNYLIFDSIKLRQVLLNLISNAIKFTPENGNILFKIDVLEQSQKNVKIYFEVKDSGIGIPKNKQVSVFEAFTQADGSVSKKFGGTGLGLTIVSKIVNLMGSKIQLESTEGKGSKFYFVVDFKIGEEIPKYLDIEYEKQLSTKLSGNILVAEDNPINIMLVEELLHKLSLKADYANNGNEVFDMFKDKDYDIILMDVNMPESDGVTATIKIRDYENQNSKKAIPIIALTANVMKGDRERFLDAGMNEHLGKPINFEELKMILRKYLTK